MLDAPHTDESKRKDNESHYPYWFQYRSRFSEGRQYKKSFCVEQETVYKSCIIISIAITGYILVKTFTQRNNYEVYTDNFNSVSADSLSLRGWVIKSEDSVWWEKRDEKPGHLALFTLKGDNWANSGNKAGIKNLVMRRINSDCFMVETHLTDFIPKENWQQAGILLSEDSTFKGKMLRLSISYNDFFGGYKKPPEIIIQAISSSESGLQSKPEGNRTSLALQYRSGKEELVKSNLARSALKIERRKAFSFSLFYWPDRRFCFQRGSKWRL